MSADMLAAFNGALQSLQHIPKQLDKNATVIPVGLDFGPSWISTSFSVDSIGGNNGEFSTGFPCGQVYTDFYQEALSKKVQSHLDFEELHPSEAPLVPTEERASELVEAFARHIEEARSMGVWALDKKPMLNLKVMAITVPAHWDVSARTVVAKAARLAGQPLDGSYMMPDLPRAVQSAYKLHQNTSGQYLTLLVLYHRSHLHLMLVQMCGTGCVMKGQVYLPHLGEDGILKASAVGTAADSDNETLKKNSPDGILSGEKSNSDEWVIELPLHHKPLQDSPIHDTPLTPEPSTSTHLTHNNTAFPDDIYTKPPAYKYPPVNLKPTQEALQKFILLLLPSNASTPANESPQLLKNAVSDIKYIVIDGEATPSGQRALRAAIEAMFTDAPWISIKGDTRDCGAYGAELAAQRQWQNPRHLGDWKDLPGYLPEKAI